MIRILLLRTITMKLSVIIPIYNSEKTISSCLDSIVDKYEDLEIICVNDGSTDNSITILNKYKSIYSYINIISIENGGVSNARNLGINCSSGDFIIFVDSDDVLLDNWGKIIFDVISQNKSNIYFFNILKELETGKKIELKYSFSNEFKRIDDLYKEFFYDGILGPWGKVFSRDFLLKNNLFFPKNMKIHEDVFFNISCFLASNGIFYSNKSFYYYKYSPSGALNKVKLQYLYDFERIFYKWKEYFENYLTKNDLDYLYGSYLDKTYKLLSLLYHNKLIDNDLEINIKNSLFINDLLDKKYSSIKRKIKKLFMKKSFYPKILLR